MAGYPPNPPGYGYGPPPPNPYCAPPPNPYGAPAQPYGSPYGAPASPYGEKPHKEKPQGSDAYGSPYGAPAPSYGEKPHKEKPQGSDAYGSPYGAPAPPYGEKPHKEKPQGSAAYGSPYDPSPPYGEKPLKEKPHASAPSAPQAYGAGGYGSPFAVLMPSAFPQGTDPSLVTCFQHADQDGSGFIDDKELQRALSSYNQSFSLRTVHLLMYLFTNSNTRRIGPKEFTQVFYSLQNWRAIFERFDRDRSGKIDSNELRDALLSLGFAVSPVVLELLVSKFDKSGGKNRAIEYDNFIECCLTVKGLTEKFKEKDTAYSGSATFTYEMFMLTVLPFLVA